MALLDIFKIPFLQFGERIRGDNLDGIEQEDSAGSAKRQVTDSIAIQNGHDLAVQFHQGCRL